MKTAIYRALDIVGAPFAAIAAPPLGLMRRVGLGNLPAVRAVLNRVGVLPIRDHYYEPQIGYAKSVDFDAARELPGINFNDAGQLAFLERMTFASELTGIENGGESLDYFHFDGSNDQFGPGDAEVWYQIVRSTKPRRIVEIGSGWSTKLAVMALARNRSEGHSCSHVCIEPYEDRGLARIGIELIRQRVEDVDLAFFDCLESGDILFIDSTHVIRPQGDVLREYLQILPRLKPSVIVHVHDIFTPRNYPRAWMVDDLRLWNEQYVLEAFLTENDRWEILAALNYLSTSHYERLAHVAPYLKPHMRPGSFYMRKVR